MTRSFAGLLFVSSALALSACNCGAICGPGTIDKDGKCVPEGDGGEGEGEGGEGEGEGEGEGVQCGPGTVLNTAGDACEPLCTGNQVFNSTTGTCVCPPGLIQTVAGCTVDPALCTEGTVFDDTQGACLPVSAQPRGDDETTDGTPVNVPLPDEDDKPVEIGGVTDRPELGFNDIDLFTFAGTAGQRLRVSVVNFGSEAASFILYGVGDPNVNNNLGAYERYGFPAAESTATREVVLPLDGQYEILVTERSGFLDGLGAVLPVGGPDYTYNLVIDVLPSPLPNTITTADPVTGSLDTTDQHTPATALVPVGSFIVANLTVDNPMAAPTMWTVVNGSFVEFGAFALFNQVTGGTRFHVDYIINQDPSLPLDYSLTIDDVITQPGPVAGTPLTTETNGEEFSFWDITLQANHVYRVRMQYPESSTLGLGTGVFSPALTQLGACELAEFDPDSDGDEVECRVFATDAEAGPAYIVVVDGVQEGLQNPNNNVRLFIDEAPVETPLSIGLGDPALVTTVDAPSDPANPDTWAGPWFFVTTSDIVDMTTTTDTGVTQRVFDRGTFGLLDDGFDTFNYIPTPGFESYLIQARGGSGTGTFAFTLSSAVPPFDVETELNNDTTAPDNLPINSPAAGVTSAGDVDTYRITANIDGLLTVEVNTPPAPLLDTLVASLTIFASDGTTVIAGPQIVGTFADFVGSSPTVSTFVTAGTYFAQVAMQDQFDVPGGAYSIAWSIDGNFVAPPSCAEPATGTLGETSGTTAGSEALWAPADDACFGFPPGAYAAPETAYEIDVPANTSLIASITDSDFDAAVAILNSDNCDPSACVDGGDIGGAGFVEQAVFTNDTASPISVTVVVDGFAGETGTFTLELALYGDVCRIGEAQCDGDNLEVCNADGSGFDVDVNCAGGCEFDAFEERAACLPFCGGATGSPQQFCDADGVTLQVCRADQANYEPLTCAVACTGDATDGLCSFGLCNTVGAVACEVEDIDGDLNDDAVIVDCNADASVAVRSACDSAATCNGPDTCSSNATPLQVCTPDVSLCAGGIEDACDATGSVQTLTYCQLGCNTGLTACQRPDFGEDCSLPGEMAFPADGLSTIITGDTSAAVDNFDPGAVCPFNTNGTGDLITAFVATENTQVTLTKDSFDGIMYRFDGTCGGTVQQCVDDFDFVDPNLDTLTFAAVAGTEYFIGIEPFGGAGGPFTLTLTND